MPQEETSQPRERTANAPGVKAGGAFAEGAVHGDSALVWVTRGPRVGYGRCEAVQEPDRRGVIAGPASNHLKRCPGVFLRATGLRRRCVSL